MSEKTGCITKLFATIGVICLGMILISLFATALSTHRPGQKVRTTSQAKVSQVQIPHIKIISWKFYTERDYHYVEGLVKNISGEPLQQVCASVVFYDKDGNFVTSQWQPIDYNPIMPGQESPFSLMKRKNPIISKAGLSFKLIDGRILRSEE